ncbi:pilus assembly protein [Intrasporangium oryzae NRRL B-24470]|uniref:Pilus assembly protein n=1 Tax=Intrasporangium oryzae NRRL B-24470 TaxID=1386089 RepID=W9G742_9MICO|nr:Flp family type IVb pilin [Intrasporangium oryzae]EWS99693.1 pilus assembly protein [Intrasporangium oryzae NRRL B-24470]
MTKLCAAAQIRLQAEKGATAVEYGLLVAFIAAVIIGAVTAIGGTLNGIFTGISTKV